MRAAQSPYAFCSLQKGTGGKGAFNNTALGNKVQGGRSDFVTPICHSENQESQAPHTLLLNSP